MTGSRSTFGKQRMDQQPGSVPTVSTPVPSVPAISQPKPKKQMPLKRKVILIAVLVLVWLVGVQVMAAERYAAVVNVIEGTDKVGVNPLPDKLDFGDLSRETGASRFVTLKNTGGRAKQIWVVKTGSIAELMKSDRADWFTLAPGEEVRLEFTVRIPVSAPYGKLSGTVTIFKWPKLF